MSYALSASSYTAQTNRVLRNTFWLLSLSLIPTIFGAWLGMALGVPAVMSASPWITLGVSLVVMFGLLFLIHSTANTALGVPSMLLFTGAMGLMLSNIISIALGRPDGWGLIAMAALGTSAVVAGCAIYATTTKRDFSGAGGFLFGSVIALFVVALANMFLQLPLLGVALSFIAVILFSAFMVFDVQRVVKGGETNYILAATSIYLNIYNIFSSILQLLLSFTSSDD